MCVLYYCHPVATQLQLTNISYYLLGTLEDMLIKVPDTDISLPTGPFTSEGTLEPEGGARIPEALYDE